MALYDFAKGLILEAGNKVRLMMQEELDIKTKSNPNDLVTNVDKATENYLYETILHNYPDHQVMVFIMMGSLMQVLFMMS